METDEYFVLQNLINCENIIKWEVKVRGGEIEDGFDPFGLVCGWSILNTGT